MAYPRLIYENLETGESIEFSPYSVYWTNVADEAVGMSDVAATVNTVTAIGQDGADWASSQIKSRKITIKGKIKTKDSMAKSIYRRGLTHVLNPRAAGRLTYVLDGFRRYILCRPEQAPLYTPGRICDSYSIDLQCPSPFWLDVSEKSKALTSFIKNWVFDWIIPEDGFVFGTRQTNSFVGITNSGDTSVGITITFSALGDVTNPCLYNDTTGEHMKLACNMVLGERIVVTTHYGNKTVSRRRVSTVSNGFRLVTPESIWLQLPVGTSYFLTQADSGAELLDISIEFTPQYLAV